MQANGSNHRQQFFDMAVDFELSGAFELLALLLTVIPLPDFAGFSLTHH